MAIPPEQIRPLFQDALEMLSLAWQSFRAGDPGPLDIAEALGRSIRKRENELTEGLLAARPGGEDLPFIPGHLERIGDAADGMVRCLRAMHAESIAFTEGGAREVDALFERAFELTQCACDLTFTGNRVLARHIEIESMRFEDLTGGFARAHEERLIQGVCQPSASSAYLAMLDHLREVVRHARRIGARIVPRSSTPPMSV